MGLAHEQMLMGLAYEHMLLGLAHENMLLGLAHLLIALAHTHDHVSYVRTSAGYLSKSGWLGVSWYPDLAK